MANTVFDYINSVNKKAGINPRDNLDEFNATYTQFVVNMAYCRYPDTIMIVEDLVLRPNLTNLQHYDYLYHTVPKSNNRFSKWHKVDSSLEIEVIQAVYKYSYNKAKEVLDLFSQDDLEKLKQMLFTGGKG